MWNQIVLRPNVNYYMHRMMSDMRSSHKGHDEFGEKVMDYMI